MGRATFEANMKTLTTVILAAGESTRMRSRRPKALHVLGGRRLIDYPLRAARALGARVVLVDPCSQFGSCFGSPCLQTIRCLRMKRWLQLRTPEYVEQLLAADVRLRILIKDSFSRSA